MTGSFLKIHYDGKLEIIDMPLPVEDNYPHIPFLEACYRELDCDSIEIVHLPTFKQVLPCVPDPVIIIDGCAKLVPGAANRKNLLCTLFYAPSIDWICGHAILASQVGPELYPIDRDILGQLCKCLVHCFLDCYV